MQKRERGPGAWDGKTNKITLRKVNSHPEWEKMLIIDPIDQNTTTIGELEKKKKRFGSEQNERWNIGKALLNKKTKMMVMEKWPLEIWKFGYDRKEA